MDSFVMVVFVILWLVSMVGGVMVLIAAFRSGIWWGLGSLLLAPVWFIFVFTHWAQAKKGFLICIASFGLMLAVAFFGGLMSALSGVAPVASVGPGVEPSGTTAPPDAGTQSQSQGSSGVGEDTLQGDAPASAAGSAEPQQAKVKKITYAYQEVPFEDLAPLLRTPVIVTTHDGREHKGLLIEATPQKITVQKTISGGKFDFELSKTRVARVQVLLAQSS